MTFAIFLPQENLWGQMGNAKNIETADSMIDNFHYHSFSGPNVYFAWLQMELCRAAKWQIYLQPLKSKVSILGFH